MSSERCPSLGAEVTLIKIPLNISALNSFFHGTFESVMKSGAIALPFLGDEYVTFCAM
jgi:hypothetical protein